MAIMRLCQEGFVWQPNKDVLIVTRFIVSSQVKSSLTNPEEPHISPDEGKHSLPARTTKRHDVPKVVHVLSYQPTLQMLNFPNMATEKGERWLPLFL